MNHYIYELRLRLHELKYTTTIAPKTLKELKHDAKRVTQMIQDISPGAVIVQAGARPILAALSASPVPTFALFGRMTNLSMAGSGPDKLPALREAMQYLCSKKKQRIVMLVREEAISPNLGQVQRVYLEPVPTTNDF